MNVCMCLGMRSTHSHDTLRLCLAQELADAIVAFSFNRLSTFQADALAGLVAALGGWGHRPPRPWLDRVCLECYARCGCVHALA